LAKPRVVRDVPDSAGDQTLWLAAQQEWRTQTAKPSYEAWLKNLVLLELTESEALIGVPSKLAYDWVADRFAEMIAETLERLLEREVTLRFEICEWLAEASANAAEEVAPEELRRVPNASALMEYTLSRRAVWTPGAQRNDGQLEYRYETEDIAGKFVIDYALGELTTAEMELVAWVLGHWDERAGSAITFLATGMSGPARRSRSRPASTSATSGHPGPAGAARRSAIPSTESIAPGSRARCTTRPPRTARRSSSGSSTRSTCTTRPRAWTTAGVGQGR